MKFGNMKYLFAILPALALTSCEDFLDRPAEDSYNVDNYYQTDDQCIAGVNYLYNSPWYDFQRGFIKVGEVLSGNYYWGSSPYLEFSVNGTDEDLVSMSCSLWAVIGHASTVYNSLKSSPASEDVVNQCMGECLAWKAMAYFYIVRSFGDAPIIHDNAELLSSGAYNDVEKAQKADVYEYIILTLEKALELLPKSSSAGRIDYYCAEALLAKVYLTKAGVSGTLNNDDLQKAADLAKDVIDNSGRQLLDNYADVFRLENNKSEESLIAWRWTADGEVWTAQNSLQSDLAIEGFDEFGDCWGGWAGMSVDLQLDFGVDLLNQTPSAWHDNSDTRLYATMFLPDNDYTYEYFWKDKGGFNYLEFIYNKDYNTAATKTLQSATGTNSVKHLYGDRQDHIDATGVTPSSMYSSLATHLLRLSDVYLIFAEAKCLQSGGINGSTIDGAALDAYYAVRHRAIPSATYPSSISWADVWKERRLELAMEGDRWYDYVRIAYFETQYCIDEIKAQKRNAYWNLNDIYENYYNSGSWDVATYGGTYDTSTAAPNVTASSFTLPFSTDDVIFNPNLGSSVAPVHVDVRSTYSY